MAYFLAPIVNDQQVDSNGAPLSGGSIYTYLAGTSSAYPTYTDNTGLTPQANPIVLNSLGLPSSPIWLTGGVAYKFTIRDALGVLQRTIDNVSGINDANVSVSQWVTFGSAPTYISATSFSVAGDQTGSFQIGRRVQCTVTAGVVYGSITASVFSTVTTVTVLLDSGALDSGLNSVALGLLTSKNTSVPTSLTAPLITPVTLSGTSLVFANSSVAADPAASNIWVSNRITLTGSAVTFTNFPAAPQAGAWTEIYCNAAHVFTNNSNLLVDGGLTYTAAIGDRVLVRAQTTTIFELHFLRISPAATSALAGTSRFGTNAEQLNGVLTNVGCTPAGLASVLSLSANGYYKFPGNLLIQWGQGTIPGPSGLSIVFPVPFANLCASFQLTSLSGSTGNLYALAAPTTSGVTVDTSDAVSHLCAWFAIGY